MAKMKRGAEPEAGGSSALPTGKQEGLAARMGGGAEPFDERQFDALVEGIQELIFGGGTDEGDLSKEMQDTLLAFSDAPHGAPEIAAQVTAQIMNAAVHGAQAQGVVLEANVVLYGAIVCCDKVIVVMEGETGLEVTPDETGQAFMKAMEMTYDALASSGIFSQHDAEAVMDEIRRDSAAFDAEVLQSVDPASIEALTRAVGSGTMTAAPEASPPPVPKGASPAPSAAPGGEEEMPR